MQPYQRASQAVREGQEMPLNLLKNAGLTALGGGAANIGSKAVSRLIPAIGAMINDYVPDNISMAGLSKINPTLGNFAKKALDMGYSYGNVRTFLGEKLEKEKEQVATDNKNLIEKHSPELHQFISNEMKKGRSHKEAGALAKIGIGGKAFDKVIDKLTKAHKTTWEDILESVYGGAQGQSQQTQAPAAQQTAQATQQQQSGQGQQALMGILNKINQRMGQQ